MGERHPSPREDVVGGHIEQQIRKRDTLEVVSDVTLPEPMSNLRLFIRGVEFYVRASMLLVSYIPVFFQSKLIHFKGDVAATEAAAKALEAEWHRTHEAGAKTLAALINDLKGFHVKVGQVIATRQDLFPQEYSLELANMVDSVNPLPYPMVRRVVEKELLGDMPLGSVFESFDPEPLGSASIAQVHHARLRDGREVAVKVQRPNIEPQLMNDIGALKGFSFATRSLFPVDYYTVTVELEEQLQDEFDFISEANAMDRIAEVLSRSGRQPPVVVPRSIPGLISERVLCMDFVPGVALSKVRDELARRGIHIEPGSRAGQIFGRRLIKSLSDAFAQMIFREGLFHADPHPGNVFVMPDGSTALIDFGQTKRLGLRFRQQIAELVVRVSNLEGCDPNTVSEEGLLDMENFARSMGVEFLPSAGRECALALALWLFDTSRTELPGGYETNELSAKNPSRDVASFPRDFVLLCRTTLLIRGIAMKLGIRWSLASAWREAALELLGGVSHSPNRPALGFWSRARHWLSRRSVNSQRASQLADLGGTP